MICLVFVKVPKGYILDHVRSKCRIDRVGWVPLLIIGPPLKVVGEDLDLGCSTCEALESISLFMDCGFDMRGLGNNGREDTEAGTNSVCDGLAVGSSQLIHNFTTRTN